MCRGLPALLWRTPGLGFAPRRAGGEEVLHWKQPFLCCRTHPLLVWPAWNFVPSQHLELRRRRLQWIDECADTASATRSCSQGECSASAHKLLRRAISGRVAATSSLVVDQLYAWV